MLVKEFNESSIETPKSSVSSDKETGNESASSHSSTADSDESFDFGENGYFSVQDGQCLKNRYEILSLLGSGGFATVHKVHDSETKTTVAMKIGRSGEMDNETCEKEIEMLELVSSGHENIVQFTSHFSVCGPYGKHFVMVFELLDTDLFTILASTSAEKRLSLDTVRRFSKDILNGLNYIHTKCGVVHCDIKPENIMISRTGTLKIGDFGLAVLNSEGCTFTVGTCHYRAPEIFLNSKISFSADLWSFGCTLFEMITRKKLFQCPNECDKIQHMKKIAGTTGEIIYQQFFKRTSQNDDNFEMVFGKHTVFVSNAKPWLNPELLNVWHPMMEQEAKEVSDLLKKILKSDPKKRLTAKKAMEHPFLSN
ncbi:hypothetical protein CAEBREN_07646 [Caenorhabditis brenneri]|uniref:non-specific serine/threonine protein kinase n=1 Tax=Caenorhabditis brenneri TaxID=135651 RepID=G0MYZ9_CAEBE|nr:hypothetical protein CAEBREN_07646 [Caenorhabditis brenneri]